MFDLEDDRPSDAPHTTNVWRVHSASAGAFMSWAAPQWEIVFMHHQGDTRVFVRGPETHASRATFPADAYWLGISFQLGTFMPHLPLRRLLDTSSSTLPLAGGKSFWLPGAAWEIPTYDNADVFAARLKREGLLLHDAEVAAALRGQPLAYSPRAMQYRFVRATGLSHKVIQQMERARQAAALLQAGAAIMEAAHSLGYYDQAHLTHSLKRFIGQTPSQIARPRLLA
jgi:AraC-like DNA-binding protein